MYSLKYVLFYVAVLFVVVSGPFAAKAFASNDVSAKSENSLIAEHRHRHGHHHHHNDWYYQGYYNSYPYYYNGYYPNYYNSYSYPYYDSYSYPYSGYSDGYYYSNPGVSVQFGF